VNNVLNYIYLTVVDNALNHFNLTVVDNALNHIKFLNDSTLWPCACPGFC
jgi:hypothetical protein